jgi:hypothetical protein
VRRGLCSRVGWRFSRADDMMRLLRHCALPIWFPVGLAALALALPGVAAAGAQTTHHQFCQVQFVAGGPVYDGVGTSVTTPSGNHLSVCHVQVPPPPETIVTKFSDSHGIVVITRSGQAIIVFH